MKKWNEADPENRNLLLVSSVFDTDSTGHNDCVILGKPGELISAFEDMCLDTKEFFMVFFAMMEVVANKYLSDKDQDNIREIKDILIMVNPHLK